MSAFTLRRAAHTPIAYRNGAYLRGSDFLRRIESVRAELEGRDERCWGLFMEDSYGFAVSLLALLLSNKSTIVLPSIQTGFLESVSEHLHGLLTDRNDTLATLPQLHYSGIPEGPRAPNTAGYDVPDGEIALFTSGSTGEPKLIRKRLTQLLSESRVLESLWGDRLGDSVVVSTVTHQHIYGLLFRVMWPLVSGRCFSATTDKDPHTFFERAMQLPRVTLVSSPAYLKRMAESVDLREIASRVAMVFSSGGPLPNHPALWIHDQLEQGVREVYGSTETGGIAHRSQTQPNIDVPWTPLPSVEIGSEPRNHCLMIASPFEGSGQWYTTADTVVFLNDGTFHLMGRADDIVKVEEKRLSLTELERRLAAVDLVSEAGATVQESFRASVVVAVVLSDRGKHFLEVHGEWQLQRHLKEYLLQYFEPVLLPRKWRFVDGLPHNPQGKLLRSAVLRLFETIDKKRVMRPETKGVSFSQTAATLSLFVPANLIYFSGHFPGHPVLPGVVQVDWAITFAREYLRVPESFRGMEAVKFHAFISPNTSLELTLRYEPLKETLRFTYASGSRRFSSGRIVLGAME